MLFKWEIEALWGGGFKSVELDPLTIWNIFYYFFGNFLHGDTDEKVDLGNKERSNEHPPVNNSFETRVRVRVIRSSL